MPLDYTTRLNDGNYSRGRLVLLFALAGLSAVALRAVILFVVHLRTGLPITQIIAGHDGAEYLKFAEAISAVNIGSVPPEARRHAPGWPLLVALFSWAGPLHYIALTVAAMLTAAGSVVTGALFHRAGATMHIALPAAFAASAVYPTQVYFGLFVLTEPLFTLLVLVTVYTSVAGYQRISYAAAAAAMLVRVPGVFLVFTLVAHDLFKGRRSALLLAPIAMLPSLAWGIWSHSVWGEGAVGILEPKLGLPFSGFLGAFEVPSVRAAYVGLSVLMFLTATALLIKEAVARRAQDEFVNLAVLFCTSFMLFHLCIRTLNYLGTTIWTFNYQDRYYIPLLPLCLWTVRSWLRWWWIAAAAALSALLSVYWAGNYFRDLLS